MKRIVTVVAALAMVAPSIAFASPAAEALSLNNAAVQPVRASATVGKKLKAVDNTTLIIGGILILAGGACAIWCGGGSSG
jgi:hypothetical protein